MTIPRPDLFSSFGVGRRPGSELADMAGWLGPGLTDHRGLIEMPALTVLFDDIGGLPFFFAEEGSSVQSRLSMSMLARPEITEELDATAELVLSDAAYGATAVRISGAGGRPLCFGSARNVRVGRELVVDGDHLQIPASTAPGGELCTVDPNQPGREVVESLAHAWTSLGPLGELLGGAVSFARDGTVQFSSTTAEWMANIMGSMHGGVIAAIVAQGLSYAAQATTPAGVGYQLIEFSVAFHRSPIVDGRTIVVHTRPIKVGRRLGVFAAELYDGANLLASGTADVRFD
ncbi:MAG: PaaI family thioesterase [Gordonia sp. (in: high G+C Gram-positive bacteria)]|uniref:PaaI family thioesterase n=1 Tax=Gordonia sp. (in: high G+C Gram-positive bacteria) TaxID=84139 RepID=UPI003BB51872